MEDREEQNVDVHLPHVVDKILEVIKDTSQERVSERILEQIVYVPAPGILEEIVQVTDVPVPQFLEGIVEVIQLVPLERIPARR